MRLRQPLHVLLYLALAAGAAWIALGIPMHFRAVSPLVLAEAAEGTPGLRLLTLDYLEAGQVGPAEMLLKALPGQTRDAELTDLRAEILADHPLYALSGGPAPFYEQWLEAAAIDPAGEPDAAVLPLLLAGDRRQHLLAFLGQSSNRTVQALLETRQLTDYERFLPVFSAAGHPLDATILTTALLEQSDVWKGQLARELRALAEAARDEPAALGQLEQAYLSVLSLGRRLNWGQLTALLARVPDLATLRDLHATTQLADDRFPTLYAGILLSGDAPALTRYLLERGDDGWRVLDLALDYGRGALTTMAAFNQPLYDPPAFFEALPLEPTQEALRGFTESRPNLALSLKALALIVAGYFLALALESLVRSFLRPRPIPRGPAVHAFHLVSGCGLAALVWILSEPRLLHFEPNEGGTLRLNLASLVPTAEATDSAMLDQVTLLVLVLFLVLQLVVFVFCLLKIKEIRAQQVTAPVKLKLLDNEENLFDLGLYVGLGGTVSALLLVVLEMVDASLMAAYASTLFGILFVAILKVIVLRPYRRQLIIEANQPTLTA